MVKMRILIFFEITNRECFRLIKNDKCFLRPNNYYYYSGQDWLFGWRELKSRANLLRLYEVGSHLTGQHLDRLDPRHFARSIPKYHTIHGLTPVKIININFLEWNYYLVNVLSIWMEATINH